MQQTTIEVQHTTASCRFFFAAIKKMRANAVTKSTAKRSKPNYTLQFQFVLSLSFTIANTRFSSLSLFFLRGAFSRCVFSRFNRMCVLIASHQLSARELPM